MSQLDSLNLLVGILAVLGFVLLCAMVGYIVGRAFRREVRSALGSAPDRPPKRRWW
jgi:hypothetical protein